MSFEILTCTSALLKGEIVRFYPCSIAGLKFLYCEANACEAVQHKDEIFALAGGELWKLCQTCSKPIEGKMKSAKYCSDYCRIRHKKIKDRIRQGKMIEKDHVFSSGYYTVEKRGGIYTVSLRKKTHQYRLLPKLKDDECAWMPKYTPIIKEGKAMFLVSQLGGEAADKSFTAFLKILLESKAWK